LPYILYIKNHFFYLWRFSSIDSQDKLHIMLTYPEIDPVLVSLGPLKVHWYGAMYALAFILGWWFATHRAKQPNSGWNTEEISDFVFFVALGVILGGRVGYVLFYNFPEFIANPLMLFKVWQGGMSFHGGVLGVMLAMYFYGRKTNLPSYGASQRNYPGVWSFRMAGR